MPDSSQASASPSQPSDWYSVRPWAPSLTLAVREITYVSATFILSSTLNADIDPSLASIGLEAGEVDQERPTDDANGSTTQLSLPERKNGSVVADALAKGLSVNVNGSAWPRAFIRIDDQLDEAVIIIYALMPGRQYDIELALASTGQPSLARRQVTTEDADNEAEIHTDPDSASPDNSTASDPHSTPSTSPSRTVPGTPPTAAPPITLQDRLTQLQQTLSTINAERETLLASLKSARKDAQKADSALRSEIDTLKRTSEKNIAAELKGKQKVLALQESVRRAQNFTKELEESADEVESMLPELNAEKEKKEREHAKIQSEAKQVRKEKEELEEKERKRMESLRSELTSLTNKLEKLGGKREKLENTIIPDLEAKLQDVAQEIEIEEHEQMRLEAEEMQAHIMSQRISNGRHSLDDAPPYVLLQRPAQHHGMGDRPGPIGRPVPNPIQRPQADNSLLPSNSSSGISQSNSVPLWAPARPLQPHPSQQGQGYSHNPRSNSLQNHSAPNLLLNTQRRSSLKASSTMSSTISAPSIATYQHSNNSNSFSPFLNSTTSTTAASSPTTSSSHNSSSPTRTSPHITASTSMLSSRAPAFEPSRSVKNGINSGNNNFHGQGGNSNSSSPSPIQRPSGSAVGSNRPVAASKNGHALRNGSNN
ncbi:hypothetical protein D9613_008651 [Agrocybe pediades]|uniref:Uncharacterized protein n=1 Tax=Agrocybe pediades TaxID=84607 RepID=A0A8H4QS84_9AGAR|nr:hypothetical protein D9613_008651 [Agrocybe pediades]